MSLRDRCAKWRDQYPDRGGELRAVMRRHLGIRLETSQSSPFAQRSLEDAENEILACVYGLPRDPEPEPVLIPRGVTQSAPLPAPKDHPPSGRDRAANDA